MHLTSHPTDHSRTAALRWAEFAAFFLVTPVAVAVLLPPSAMFLVLLGVTALGLVLLHITEGFRWAELLRGWRPADLWLVAGFAMVTALASAAVMQVTDPQARFFLLRQYPELLLAIVVLYPLLSALPQEVVFRPLFFRRYGALMPGRQVALLVNAGVFSLAHLLYWSWVVAVLTFAGGLAFAWAYEVRRSFLLAVALHAVAGCVLFVMGMGVHFYTGNITRPF